MADLQKHFELFHNKIRISTEPLVEKRDIIINVIRDYLRSKGLPSFEVINQGSYIYGVGIRPLNGNEYDIDVGLAFNVQSKDYPDARVVRKWVLEAVSDHTDKVRDRGPCIRVHYARGFHVDLVVYARSTDSSGVENFQLGKQDGGWSPTAPKKLKEFIRSAIATFDSTKVEGEATQLQRVVRYLKRWNDLRFPDDAPNKPTGISLLLLAIEKLSPTLSSNSSAPDDLKALINFCNRVLRESGSRISVLKPTPEFEDVFAKIDESEMRKLLLAFGSLSHALLKAQSNSDVVEASRELAIQFGDSFPVLEEVRKSEIVNALTLDETDLPRLAKIESLRSIASGMQNAPKPHRLG